VQRADVQRRRAPGEARPPRRALRRQEDFINVLGRSKPTVAERELERFELFTKEFGSDGS